MSTNIILVDDNSADAFFSIRAMNRNNAEYNIESVDGGEALFESLAQHKSLPSLILLDMHMPGMSGLEVLSKLKRDDRYQAIPVVMLTSSRYEKDIVKSYAAGATSYIVKPLNEQKLSEVLSNLDSLDAVPVYR